MTIHKYLAVPLFTAASLFLSAAPAFAMETARTDRMEARQEMVAKRCDVSDARTKLIVERYDNNYPMHVGVYKKIVERTQVLVTNLKAEGKDTTALEATLKTLNEKILTLDTQSKAVIAQLKVAQGYACGESHGQYVTEIKKAHDLALTAHATLLDIRSYYQSSVRPAMLALRTK